MDTVLLRTTLTDIQVRFADTDMLGHINNTSYAAYLEVGRSDFFTSLAGEVPWFVLARMEFDFLKEGFLQDALQVRTSAERLGTTSMTLRQDIFRGDVCVVSAKCVLVCIDRESRSKGAIPTNWQIAGAEEHALYVTRLHAARESERGN